MYKLQASAILWIVIIGAVVSDTSSLSSSINGIFTTRSILSSSLSSNLIDNIANGAQVAYEHCQKAFKWERWNCPESTFARRFKHAATKELAYTKAITSAGIVHTITKNCSRGEIQGCGCDSDLGSQSPLKIPGRSIDQAEYNRTELKNGEPMKWTWGGCSDHIDYGTQVAKTYLDDLEKSDDPQSQIHLHNNQIGREIVRDTMIRRCVCHGVSGSCALQTCWMQVAPFATIAQKLKDRYARAVRMDIESDNSAVANSIVDIPKESGRDLIYLDDSPDYCKPDNATGWMETKGRTCSRSKLEAATWAEKRSCRNVCRTCGHRVRKQKRVIKERCRCKFQWCCEVKCEVCTKTVEELTCG